MTENKNKPSQTPLWCVKADGETHWLLADTMWTVEGGGIALGHLDHETGLSVPMRRDVARFSEGHWESVIRCNIRGYPDDQGFPLEPVIKKYTAQDGTEITAIGTNVAFTIKPGEQTYPNEPEARRKQRYDKSMSEMLLKREVQYDHANQRIEALERKLENLANDTSKHLNAIATQEPMEGTPVDPPEAMPVPRHSREKLDAVVDLVRKGVEGALDTPTPPPGGWLGLPRRPLGSLREAEASVRLDGDTISAEPTGPHPEDYGKGYGVSKLDPGGIAQVLEAADRVAEAERNPSRNPPSGPSNALTIESVSSYHLKQGKALCTSLGLPRWRVVTPGRLDTINKRIKVECPDAIWPLDAAQGFWSHVVSEALGNINIEDWMTLDILLRVPRRGGVDHFLKSQEGGYRTIVSQNEDGGDGDIGIEGAF